MIVNKDDTALRYDMAVRLGYVVNKQRELE